MELLRDAVDLFSKQTTIVNSLWQNYSYVTGLLLGFGATGFVDNIPLVLQIAASIAFAMFSFGNWVLIRQACTVHAAAENAITSALRDGPNVEAGYRDLLTTLVSTANSVRHSRIYHLTIDAAVFAAIWLPSLVRQTK